MKPPTLKQRIFSWLIKGEDIRIFSSPDSSIKSTLRQSFLLSSFCRKLFNLEISNLEAILKCQAFLSTNDYIGRIDFCDPVNDGNYAVRGWLFSPFHPLKSLSLNVEGKSIPVFAHKLKRIDVMTQVGFLENSNYSGFVASITGPLVEADKIEISFSAEADNGITTGCFETLTKK